MSDTTSAEGQVDSPPANLPSTVPERPEARPQQNTLDQLIFKRDLNETHLLMDFLSGRSDKSLLDLTLPDPDQPANTLQADEVVRRIALLRYPPSADDVIKADDASFLLLAKDRLSRLAAPARGTTIGYTAMFAESGRPLIFMLSDRVLRRPHGAQKPRRPEDSRLSLAIETFPGLRTHALSFRRTFSVLPLAALIWLLLTVLTYWEVALSQSVLGRLGEFYKERIAILQDNPDLIVADACPRYDPKQSAMPEIKNESAKIASACNHLWSLERSRHEASLDLKQSMCFGIAPNLVAKVLGLTRMLCDPSGSASVSGTVGWQSATSVLSVLSTYVLPMMFAVLGTIMAIMRHVHNKVRDSELAPRDRMLMLLGLPMGAIAGVAVGLFFSPLQGTAGTGPIGNLTLTASGLGFLAGYGAEAFFRFLDSVLRSVFPDRDSMTASAHVPRAVAFAAHPGEARPPAQ